MDSQSELGTEEIVGIRVKVELAGIDDEGRSTQTWSPLLNAL